MKAHRRTGLGPKNSIRVFAFWSFTALALLIPSQVPAAQKLCYTIYDSAVTLATYSGPGGVVEFPSNGLSLKVIANSAFSKRDDITSIIIPETIRIVEEGAFSGCQSLTNVTLPSNLAQIHNKTFSGCSKLTSITIPPNVLSIGEGAFRDCVMLTNVVFLGSRVGSIGRSAFAGCTRLKQITLPPYIDTITNSTFEGCSQLAHIVIPESVITIGERAFYSCTALTNLNIPEGVIGIDYNAFTGCSRLKSLTTAAPYIQSSAFSGCTNLIQLNLLPGVVKIYYRAFEGLRRLTNLFLPDSVTYIDPSAFSGCTSLASVTTGATNIGSFTDSNNLQALYCTGNPPGLYGSLPSGTVYYLPWTSGWKQTLGGRPTAVWQPRLRSPNAGVAAKTNQFEFNIQWAAGAEAKVDACVDLVNPDWKPVATNTVGSDGLAYFTDPDSTNYPTRFYRVRWP